MLDLLEKFKEEFENIDLQLYLKKYSIITIFGKNLFQSSLTTSKTLKHTPSLPFFHACFRTATIFV